MSKGQKKKTRAGTDKQMLAAVEMPVAVHDAEQPVADGATSNMTMTTTDSGEHGTDTRRSEGELAAVADAVPAVEAAAPPTPIGVDTAVAAEVTEETVDPKPASNPVASARLEVAAVHGTLGPRLRAAREARNWSIEEVSSRLHIPFQIIRALEAEQYERIGYGVYLRGYLMTYARLVDLPTILVDNVVRERNHSPPLVTSGTISHSRYLYQRYSVSALYLILTGVIIVPAVLLAMRASLQPAVTQLTPLDASPVSAPAEPSATTAGPAPGVATGAPGGTASAEITPANPPAEAPLVASLAPFSALSHKDATHGDAATSAGAPAASVPPSAHTLKLTLKEPSWVEVVSASGDKLEYGLLPAGTTRTYSSDKALEVRLGNSNGAEVETDGTLQDLAPYRRSNVAHFRLFAAGEKISRIDQ